MPDDVIHIAHLFSFVREAQSLGQNRGLRVEAIQHWAGGAPGDSWCAEFATMVLDIAYAGNAPIPRVASCEWIREWARQHGRLSTAPQLGDLFLYVNSKTDRAHHIGFVTALGPPILGLAGNTSPDGLSDNGDGVYEHEVHPQEFVHYL